MRAKLAAAAVIGFGMLAGMVGFVSTILSFVLQLCALYAGWILFAAQRRRLAELETQLARAQQQPRAWGFRESSHG